MADTLPIVRMRLDAWSYSEFIEFSKAMRDVNLREAFRLADKLIESWTYKEPFEAGALKRLNVADAMRVLRSVLDRIQSFTENINTDDVVIDFSDWTLETFLEFNDLREAGNVEKVMQMVRKVALVDGANEDEEPTMVQGAKMLKGVTDAIGAILAGKN